MPPLHGKTGDAREGKHSLPVAIASPSSVFGLRSHTDIGEKETHIPLDVLRLWILLHTPSKDFMPIVRDKPLRDLPIHKSSDQVKAARRISSRGAILVSPGRFLRSNLQKRRLDR